ncbi:MAG: DUF2267 domain-containing protein [Nanoarchaeota archaeon]
MQKIFDDSLEKTYDWIKEASQSFDGDMQRGYRALRAVLHATRDRIMPEEAAHLSAQMPLVLRGVFYEHWNPAHKPERLDKAAFLDRISKELSEDMSAEDALKAVTPVMKHNIDLGERQDVYSNLPPEIVQMMT